MSGSSIRRTDILALSDLRDDGRRPGELRRIRVQMGPMLSSSSSVTGSALIEMGLTTALATVRGPVECHRRSDEDVDRAVLDVTVKTSPFASAASSDHRPSANPITDRRLAEASHMVKRALEASVLLHLFPRSRIDVVVCVLADDGSRLCAAINAATLALVDAGVPMKDFVCSCSAGYAGGAAGGTDAKTLVDLNRREETSSSPSSGHAGNVYLPCAMMPQRGTIVLAQCEARLPDFDTMERVMDAAMDGCRAVFDVMQAAVRERASLLLASKEGRAALHNAFP